MLYQMRKVGGIEYQSIDLKKNITNNVFHHIDKDINQCFSVLYIQTKAKYSPNNAKESNSLHLPHFIK